MRIFAASALIGFVAAAMGGFAYLLLAPLPASFAGHNALVPATQVLLYEFTRLRVMIPAIALAIGMGMWVFGTSLVVMSILGPSEGQPSLKERATKKGGPTPSRQPKEEKTTKDIAAIFALVFVGFATFTSSVMIAFGNYASAQVFATMAVAYAILYHSQSNPRTGDDTASNHSSGSRPAELD